MSFIYEYCDFLNYFELHVVDHWKCVAPSQSNIFVLKIEPKPEVLRPRSSPLFITSLTCLEKSIIISCRDSFLTTYPHLIFSFHSAQVTQYFQYCYVRFKLVSPFNCVHGHSAGSACGEEHLSDGYRSVSKAHTTKFLASVLSSNELTCWKLYNV
jgi:hypothetical protein